MLGIQTNKQPITGKYAKRLTELLSHGKSDSKVSPTVNQANPAVSSDKKHKVVWE